MFVTYNITKAILVTELNFIVKNNRRPLQVGDYFFLSFFLTVSTNMIIYVQ